MGVGNNIGPGASYHSTQAALHNEAQGSVANMTVDIAMDDMELDFTTDEQDPEIARLQAEADAINAQAELMDDPVPTTTSAEPVEEGELDESAPAPTKIHIRGLNHLNTVDVEAWVQVHGQSDLFKRVQWVDDSSANLIFDNEIAAAEALRMLSATDDTTDAMQFRAAKSLSTHPDTVLEIRTAMASDVKAPRAKERSAFYLFNKEWDPDNPDNLRPDRKRKRYENGFRAQKRRRRGEDVVPFIEDMYDDDAGALARRASHSSGSDLGRPGMRRAHEDLMARDRRGGRLRDRSASPVGDGDGRYGFNDEQPFRRTARARSISPVAGRDNRGVRDKLRKELFPEKKAPSGFTATTANGKTTQPSEALPPQPSTARELFPDRLSSPVHRRQDAQDLHPDEVARAIGQYTLDGAADHSIPSFSTPRTYSTSRPGTRSDRNLPSASNGAGGSSTSGRDLFSRVEGGPKVDSRRGRLNNGSTGAGDTEGFNIRGAGARASGMGFSVLGASREGGDENSLVKELFPLRSGGDAAERGKEVFDGRIKGRGGASRRRAEDMF